MKLHVPEMSCAHCVKAIEQAVETAGGRAVVSLEDHIVDVDGLEPATAQAAIREAGYESNIV